MKYLQSKDSVGAFLLLLFSLFYLRSALAIVVDSFDAELGFTSKTLPLGLAASAILVSTILLFSGSTDKGGTTLLQVIKNYHWRPTLSLVLLMAVYSTVFGYLGFILSSFLFLQISFMVLGEHRILYGISISAGLVVFLWFILTKVFGLYMDYGTFFSAIFE